MSSATSKQFPFGFPKQVGVSGTTNGGPLNQDVPTSPTDLATTDSYLFQISLTNGTAGALTITVSDKQSPVKHVMDAASIPANTTVCFNWDEGVFMQGGITWSASGAGVDGNIVAFSK